MTDFLGSMVNRVVVGGLSPRPRIRKEGNILLLESTWRTALLTLGGRSRRVSVNPNSRVIRIQDRTFWVVSRSRRIEFDWVEEIIYAYRDLMGSDWVSHTSQDLFTVGLKLRSGERVILFRIYGPGEYVNNSIWPDWMVWDEILPGQILPGNHEGVAGHLADVLSGLIRVPIGNDL